jgi:aspartyl-tRNA(Asn)/glutamyl-tRNA(Gln) amidotransferase subunit C
MTEAEVKKVAKLAKLAVSDAEVQAYAQQLSRALGYFEQIAKVDTAGLEPLVTPTEMSDFWRDDAVEKTISTEEIIENAPQKTGHLFTVPPVV